MGKRKNVDGTVHAMCPAPLDFTAILNKKGHPLHRSVIPDKNLAFMMLILRQSSNSLTYFAEHIGVSLRFVEKKKRKQKKKLQTGGYHTLSPAFGDVRMGGGQDGTEKVKG